MISVSQAVQSLISPNSATSVQLSRTALLAASVQKDPSTVVSLGTTVQRPVLYTATGQLNGNPAAEANAGAEAEANALTTPTARQGTTVTETENAGTVGTAIAGPSAAAAATTAANTATAGNAAPLVPVLGDNAPEPLAVVSTVDPDAQALKDFTTNPVHGGVAAALSLVMSAAIYRAPQDAYSSTSLVNAIDLPGPVTSLNAINVDITDLEQRTTAENQQDQRWVLALEAQRQVQSTYQSAY